MYLFYSILLLNGASHVSQLVKNPLANEGERDMGSIRGLGRPSGEGNGNPLQYSYLENPVDRGTCWATVHGFAETWTWPSTNKDWFYY